MADLESKKDSVFLDEKSLQTDDTVVLQEDDGAENSRIEAVRLVVPITDDPSLVAITFRFWIISFFFAVIGAVIQQYYFYRSTSGSFSTFFVNLASYGLGKIMARTLPTDKFTLGGFSMSLNPGPFNIKEHALIGISVSTAANSAYAIDILSSTDLFLNHRIDVLGSLLLIITTQCVGYGMAGVLRKYLVYPAEMVWWSNLVQWTSIGGATLWLPLYAQLCSYGGMILNYWIILPIWWLNDTLGTKTIGRPLTSRLFYENGTMFDINSVLNPDYTDDPTGLWTGQRVETFWGSGLIYGALGPARMFALDGKYGFVYLGFVIGLVIPVILWALSKRFPSIEWSKFNVAIIAGGMSAFPNGYAVGIFPSVIVCVIFQYYIFRYHKGWWKKYVFILSAALDTGAAFTGLIIFLFLGGGISSKLSVTIPSWWANHVAEDGTNAPYLAVDRCGAAHKAWTGGV
ncbi:hypothetical protein KVV02_000220 [Mortierella alpina]|uniref:Uncharacterized protein n=1 Tax=Mortierella alpina TaxID=64518 RepID=A0A9P8D3K9_MORAP|nr:hypothetical protein KVV02_000220 [Mortierella alpina]